jgi:hypothetical protein
MLVKGGSKAKKNSSVKNRVRRMKGGNNQLPLSPFTLADDYNLGPMPRGGANYEENPLTVPSSTMVGGGYGYVNDAADVPSFAGSYFPVSRVCTADTPDNNSRGGNNFSQGGGAGSPNPYSPASVQTGGRKKCSGGSKNKHRTMKKWRQRGCNRKGGSKKKKTKGGSKKKW